MKKLIGSVMLLFCFACEAKEACKIKTIYQGIYFNQCPSGMLITGVDVRINGTHIPFTSVYVACSRPEIICSK